MTELPNKQQNTRLSHLYPQHNLNYQNNNEINCQQHLKLNNETLEQLTDDCLKSNVEIVLNNINRDYKALKEFLLLNDKMNKSNLKSNMSTPESDCNSNMGPLGTSISSQDFTHDNSDYQWFLDYGYREGVTHHSVLSSLSASYNGIGELSYYEDLAKNIDANLAEVDMESFRAEDIHSLLTNLPSLGSDKKKRRKLKDLDNSICRSELLFSPVKETHISVDSLDLDGYIDDDDIILTCQANKDNYTIAFEGSTFYSDESYCDGSDISFGKLKHNSINMNFIDDIVRKKALEVSMCKSDNGLTTWSKLKEDSSLHRYPSGNNNTSLNIMRQHTSTCVIRKSSSTPNLQFAQSDQLNLSQALSLSSSTVDSYKKQQRILPIKQVKKVNVAQGKDSDSSNNLLPNVPSFNLVKLFIKQKSSSTEMDVSSVCWPSDSGSSEENKNRKECMNDSGKDSGVSQNNDDTDTSIQFDSLDISTNQTKPLIGKNNDLYRQVFDSPSHKNYKECNLNIKNNFKSKTLYNLNNNNSIERDSLSDINKSLSDASRTSDNITQVFTTKTNLPFDTITRSIQTSINEKNKYKIVPPSFLSQLTKLGEKQRAPVYVIYPDYALPDLEFIHSTQEVVLSPISHSKSFTKKNKRPCSLIDTRNVKHNEYKHINDWKSLVTLLPNEYRLMLRHIPEANVTGGGGGGDESSQRPLFCMNPPIRKSRTTLCDCANYLNCSSSSGGSGSSRPVSSGYRGSSTILTGSELESTDDPKELPPKYPRTILRRNSYKNKRHSMFEQQQQKQIGYDLDKRRSLQEPYYMSDAYNIIEDYITEKNDMDTIHKNKINKPARTVGGSRPITNKKNYQDYEFNANSNDCDVESTKVLNNSINYTTELNKNQKIYANKQQEKESRLRTENILNTIPKSELKYYANILDLEDETSEPYDQFKLRNEVSRVLSTKTRPNNKHNNNNENVNLLGVRKAFDTPPNSPNISVMAVRTAEKKNIKIIDKEKLEKIQFNRFKRLQIQWELLSKDSRELASDLGIEPIPEIKSGGSTPTGISGQKSRIPRPVSYPAAKTNEPVKSSPSRLAKPKKFTTPIASTTPATPRTPNKLNKTPKQITTRPTTRAR